MAAQSETVTKALLQKLKEEKQKNPDIAEGIDLVTKRTAFDLVQEIVKLEQRKQEAEYKKLIENGNGNGNH